HPVKAVAVLDNLPLRILPVSIGARRPDGKDRRHFQCGIIGKVCGCLPGKHLHCLPHLPCFHEFIHYQPSVSAPISAFTCSSSARIRCCSGVSGSASVIISPPSPTETGIYPSGISVSI